MCTHTHTHIGTHTISSCTHILTVKLCILKLKYLLLIPLLAAGPDVVMVLMGTKLDLVMETPAARQVAANEAKGVATSKHMIDAVETSSKEDTNIGKTFKKLAKALKQKYEGLKAMDDHEESVHLATQSVNEKQTDCKC